MSALTTLLNGGDDQQGGPVQCTLLAAAAAAVPEEGSLELQAIQAIEASLTYPQAPVKVKIMSCELPLPCAITQGIWC